jgi:tetratricopeptide (TPR) repeat protein
VEDGPVRRRAALVALASIAAIGGSLALDARSCRAQADEAPPPAEAAWTRGRALADSGRFDEALEVVRAALARDPDDTGLLWLEAGVVGWAGRHHESVTLFESLGAKHPDFADRVRLDLATQRLWAGDARGALADVDRHLEAHPGDRDARRARALVLSFSDRTRAAAAEYERLLAEDPTDAEARVGFARALNWAGKHRRAAREYRALLDDRAGDPEVLRGLAYAEYWDARPDRARAPLASLLARRPDDAEGVALDRRLARDARPALTASHSGSDDSDDLRVLADALALSVPIGARDVVSAIAERVEVKDPAGEHRLTRPGIGYQRIWSDAWSSAARINFQDQRTDTLSDRVLWDLGVRYRPMDGLRFEIGLSRDQVLTRRALDRGVTVATGFVGVEYEPAPRWILHGSIRGNDYRDGNRSWLTRGAVSYRVLSRRDLTATGRIEGRYLAARDDLDNGYYDPIGYAEVGPGVSISWEPRVGCVIETAGRTGLQKERGGESDPFFSMEARVEAPLGASFAIGGDASRSDSNLSSESGFERTAWSLYLTARR